MRTILHSDLNAFYASVECLYRPEIRDKPVAVCGDPQARHGIVLTKNEHAKRYGVRTGEAVWQARQKCPGLVVVPPNGRNYQRFSRWVRDIYAEYTDRVEPFGLDEAWLDVTGQDGARLADELRRRIREEFGITASVGVADNKIFAKLGSDMKKPDATTVITREYFREKVWPLPVGDLLYVGPATRRKLTQRNLLTIGDVACCDVAVLRGALGKAGEMLHTFANGEDRSPVARIGEAEPVKSIGNSTTPPRDLRCDEDAKYMLTLLAESVGARLREQGFCCRVVQISVRDCELFTFERQARLEQDTDLTQEIAACALALFRRNYRWERPVRSVGVRVTELSDRRNGEQVSLFDAPKREAQRSLEKAVDGLRARFGEQCVQRGMLLCDPTLTGAKSEETYVHRALGWVWR